MEGAGVGGLVAEVEGEEFFVGDLAGGLVENRWFEGFERGWRASGIRPWR